jgi:hypothetical protein
MGVGWGEDKEMVPPLGMEKGEQIMESRSDKFQTLSLLARNEI